MDAPKGRVLIIAGSDSGGGAGVQADIKTVCGLGAYAMTAIAAVTVQDTKCVHSVHLLPVDVVRQQIDVTLADIGADVIKIGMLGSGPIIETVADAVTNRADAPRIILDPVLTATSGDGLGGDGAAETLRARLLPKAFLLTPNIPEAEALTGAAIRTVDDMAEAGRVLVALGAGAVLVKGGHARGDALTDVLVDKDGVRSFQHRRIGAAAVHGTGCTLASAIAASLAWGEPLETSIAQAQTYVRDAIEASLGFGGGARILNHAEAARRRRLR